MENKNIRVAVIYRVIQAWRAPVFDRLAHSQNIDLCVFHSKSFQGTKVVNFEGEKNFETHCLPTIRLKINTRNGDAAMPVSPTLFWQLVKFRPDVILCEGASNLINNIFAYTYKILFRKKMIWWSLGEIKNRTKSRPRKLLDGLIKFLERRMDGILVYSSYGKEYFLKLGIPEEKIFVAVNVVDTELKKKQISELDTKKIYDEDHKDSLFNVLFVGALTHEKNLGVLLEAFKKFEDKAMTKLTIIGDGSAAADYRKLAKDLKIKNINFTGDIRENISKYFLGSDLFVLPGLGGLAISDALVHGLPVIASIADGCEKDLLDTGAGVIEEQLTVDILLGHLENLYQHPELLLEMKQCARSAIEKYGIESYMDSVIDSIIRTRCGA